MSQAKKDYLTDLFYKRMKASVAPAATAASVGRYQGARGRGRRQHSGLPGAVFGCHATMS